MFVISENGYLENGAVREWYLAKSEPNKESWLTNSLTNFGVEVFFPRIARLRRTKHVNEPLFTTYVFCRLDRRFLEEPAVRWAPGLNYFLGADSVPSSISNGLVHYLKQSVNDWNSHFDNSEKLFEPLASNVEFVNYPILEDMFQKYLSPRRRCRLLFRVVGMMAAVEAEYDMYSSVHLRV